MELKKIKKARYKKMKIKTIDLNALEWFDKINGNSYFAGTIIINYGLKTEKIYIMPFQYGYGSQYEYAAFRILEKEGYFKNLNISHLWQVQNHGVILRSDIKKNCLKKELKAVQ
jgi:hypothetical protein